MNPSIAFACDEVYAMPLATALRSLFEACSSEQIPDIYVLANGVREQTCMKVEVSLARWKPRVYWLPVELDAFGSFETLPHISKMTYARLELPNRLPSSIKRILYLDSDVLVLDDLSRLFNQDLGGMPVGAVMDGLDNLRRVDPHMMRTLPSVGCYFNAGMLLIDLDRWRTENISERAMQYLAENPKTRYADQDALNAVCDGRWQRLDPRWNYQNAHEKRLSKVAAEDRPGIVHFVMAAKPWNPAMVNINNKFYDGFRSRTLFARSSMGKMKDFSTWHWSAAKRVLKRTGLAMFIDWMKEMRIGRPQATVEGQREMERNV